MLTWCGYVSHLIGYVMLTHHADLATLTLTNKRRGFKFKFKYSQWEKTPQCSRLLTTKNLWDLLSSEYTSSGLSGKYECRTCVRVYRSWLTECTRVACVLWERFVVNNGLQHVDICRWWVTRLLYHTSVAVRSTGQSTVTHNVYTCTKSAVCTHFTKWLAVS